MPENESKSYLHINLEILTWITTCVITFSLAFAIIIGDFGYFLALCLCGFLSGNLTKKIDEGIEIALISLFLGDSLLIFLVRAFNTELRNFIPFHHFSLFELAFTVLIPSMICIATFAALGASAGGQRISRLVLREKSMILIDHYCPSCGMYVSSSDQYCSNCGISLLELEE
ncbi:MAG: zinc ribbon domain-containing protein [Promethearchaeota archaeon]